MRHMRLTPRYTGDATRRTCRGCWREFAAEHLRRYDGRRYMASYCRECHREIARRSGRKRYRERGAEYRAAKVAAVCEARRRRTLAARAGVVEVERG